MAVNTVMHTIIIYLPDNLGFHEYIFEMKNVL